MAQLTTESLWHFAGYLHLQDLLNLAPASYSGAPTYKTEPYVGSQPPEQTEFDVDFSGGVRGYQLGLNVPLQPATLSPPIFFSPLELANFAPPKSLTVGEFPDVLSAPPVRIGPLGGSFANADIEIPIRYIVGGSDGQDVLVTQSNTLFDLDVVLGIEKFLNNASSELDSETKQALEDTLEVVEGLMPSGLLEILANPDQGLDRSDPFSNEFVPDLSNGSDNAPAISIDGSGQYVDGEKVDGEPQEISAQLNDIGEIVQSARFELDSVVSEIASPEDDSEVTDVGNALEDGASQTISLGGNGAANAAVLFDLEEALSSRIIHGDYFETNLIVQINVLSDTDTVDVSGAAFVEQLMTSDNSIRNEATIVDEEGNLFGDLTRGIPGASEWEVTYVYGDFYDVSTVVQNNALFDNDVNHTDQTHSQYTATLGEDGQLNIVQLEELGSGYDLIIVVGDYHKLNAILQTNIVLDDDLISLYAGPGNGDAQSVTTGGNVLLNDAAIYNIGGATANPLSDEALALSEAIGNFDSEIDGALAIGLPGDGDDIFEVLYVTGDYFNYNIVAQTNVIADVDTSDQTAVALNDITAATDQSVKAGENSAENAAIIYDLDSQSEYQFIGGDVYEDTILVQANIVENDDTDLTNYSDLDEDVIATVAAQTGSDQDGQGSTIDPSGQPTNQETSNTDVMGGMLT